MVSIIPLRNPPIQEALVDLRVQVSDGTTFDSLDRASTALAQEYPERKERREGIIQVQFQRQSVAERVIQQDKPMGVVRASPDGKRLVQFRLDGFTFNRLRPYTTWAEMRDEAKKAWVIYQKACGPRVVRAALRYINVLEVKVRPENLSDWLTAPPKVPGGVESSLSDFLTRVSFADSRRNARAIVSQAYVPGEGGAKITIDIDVFREGTLVGEKEVWDSLEELRELKNELFFGSLGRKALELCK